MNFDGKYKDLIQPDKLHVLSLSILINQLTSSRGGTAANIAYSLALMGENPILLASIGNDAGSYISDLSNLGVDTNLVHVSHLETATFTVLTDSDDNQIGGFYPGAMSDISHLTLKPWYGKNALVVISAGDPLGMDQLVRECQENGLDYAYDVGQQVTNITVEQMKLGLSAAKILFVNDYELGRILARTHYPEAKINQMIPLVVITLGSKGTKITGSLIKKPVKIKALKNIIPIDPTGAGDAYRAGFLYGYLRNWGPSQCAELGSVVAAYTVEKYGTQTHTFALDKLMKRHLHAYDTNLQK